MAILDLIESKPSFFRDFWEVPAFRGEPDPYRHRLSFLVPPGSDRKRLHGCSGSGLTSGDAVKACLGEAVERYSAYKRDLKKIRLAAWNEFREEALHPDQLAGFSPSQFRDRRFPYHPFTENVRIGWVQGISLVRGSPVWVPAQWVYLASYLNDEVPIAPRISTGMACGSSRAQAILHGLYEAVERDALTILWLNKLSMPLVSLNAQTQITHPLMKLFLKKFARPHLVYRVIQMTTDLGIPAYCATVESKTSAWPKFVIGCVSRLSAVEAITGALLEAITGRSVLLYGQKSLPAFTAKKSIQQVFKKVYHVQDHALAYADARFKPYADFMWASRVRVPLCDLPNLSKKSHTKDLETCLTLLKQKGLDCIAVDVTPKAIAAYDLTVVKVIIPGLQPLHFGWHFEFLRNQRLYEVPMRLGYFNRPTTEKEIYRIPHPMM